MSEKMIYRAAPVFTRAELNEALESDEPDRIAEALASAVRYEDDWSWTQELCLKFLKSPDVQIRWAAATCLGDLAFFFHRPIDVPRVLTALYTAAEDPAVSGPAFFSMSLIKERFPPN
jgi:hypothetical protein